MVYLSKCQYPFLNSQLFTMLLFILYIFLSFYILFCSTICVSFLKYPEIRLTYFTHNRIIIYITFVYFIQRRTILLLR